MTRAWFVTVAAALCVAACTGIKRVAIRAQVRDAFVVPAGTELTQLTSSVYVYRWLGNCTMFITTADGVILFDPVNENVARGVAAHIAKVAPNKSIKFVIYSHFHRDHASGAAVLPGHPAIVAHANAARELAMRSLPEVVPPTEVFTDEVHDISLGDSTVRLIHLPYSHTDGLVMAYLPRERILFETDIIWLHQLPPPGVPDYSFAGVKRATEMMLDLEFDTLVAAHGCIGKKSDVVRYRDFLVDIERQFRAALAERGLSDLTRPDTQVRGKRELADVLFQVEDALRPDYGDWLNFDAVILSTSIWCFWHIFTGT